MKKFSLFESKTYTDDEIEDHFIDYIDDGKKFEIIHGFLSGDNTFFIDRGRISEKSRNCRKITIDISGIFNGLSDGMNKCITDIDSLQKIINKIKVFYTRTGSDQNFLISQRYGTLEVIIFLIGDVISKSDLDISSEMDLLLNELKDILINRGYKNAKLKSKNFLDIRPKKYPKIHILGNDYLLIEILKKAAAGELPNNDRNLPLIEWATKAIPKYKIVFGGGDDQVVVSLKLN